MAQLFSKAFAFFFCYHGLRQHPRILCCGEGRVFSLREQFWQEHFPLCWAEQPLFCWIVLLPFFFLPVFCVSYKDFFFGSAFSQCKNVHINTPPKFKCLQLNKWSQSGHFLDVYFFLVIPEQVQVQVGEGGHLNLRGLLPFHLFVGVLIFIIFPLIQWAVSFHVCLTPASSTSHKASHQMPTEGCRAKCFHLNICSSNNPFSSTLCFYLSVGIYWTWTAALNISACG